MLKHSIYVSYQLHLPLFNEVNTLVIILNDGRILIIMVEYQLSYKSPLSQLFAQIILQQLLRMLSNKSQKFMKWKTYLLTFFAYVALHTMRMSYSQVKPKFQKSFQLSNLFLGLFDALVYLSLGTGFIFRFLLEGKKNLIKSYIIFISIATLAYLVIPFTSLIMGHSVTENYFFQEILPGIALLIFGFCQFPAWPTLLTLTNQHFNLQKEGSAMGAWSANGDLGNIIGFGLAGILVDGLDCDWELAMIVAAAFNILMAISVVIFLKGEDSQQNKQQSLLENDSDESPLFDDIPVTIPHYKFKRFLKFTKQTIKPIENKLYLLSMGLLKSILYGFLLWMPTYLDHNGFKSYTSIIPIVFNAGTLFGSFFLGYFYKDHSQTNSNSFIYKLKMNFRTYSLFYSCIALTIILAIFYGIDATIVAYFFLSAICGFFLGGCFNMLASNEVLAITGGRKEEVNMLSTLSMVCGNIMVGLVEILIGVVLDLKHSADGEKQLFILLLSVGVVAISVLFWRSRIIHNKAVKQAVNSSQFDDKIKSISSIQTNQQ